MKDDTQIGDRIAVIEEDDSLTLKIKHSGLQGKIYQGGTNKLVYILLGTHSFVYLLLLDFSHNLIFTLFSYILRFIFTWWELNLIWVILYSCFGFTRIELNRTDFVIVKSLWGIKREVTGETIDIKQAKVNPVSVFANQYRSFGYLFSSNKTVTYAYYLLSDPEYSFGAMSDRHNIEIIAERINSYLQYSSLRAVAIEKQ